jgi:membrane associated rhomboid family serine protease
VSIFRDLKLQFKAGNLLTQLIVINCGVFLLINLIRVFLLFTNSQQEQLIFNQVLSWLAMPLDVHSLLARPWTLITHFFLHYELFHLFWNMVIFYTFGRIFQEYNGNSRILSLYCYGALCGALLALLAYKLIPALSQSANLSILLGASGGIMAVVVAAATLLPNHLIGIIFIGEVRLKYIALFVVLIDVISIPVGNAGGHVAHLGGALFGYIFVRSLKSGFDLSKGFNKVFYGITGIFKRRSHPSSKIKVVHRDIRKVDEDYNLNQKRTQEQVDLILDKISKSGYESLSKSEKEILFKVSGNKE